MVKDKRYSHVKEALENGEIILFRDIFRYIPKTVVAVDLGIKGKRFNYFMFNVGEFRIGHLTKLAELLEIDPRAIQPALLCQYKEDQKAAVKAAKLAVKEKPRKKRT